MDTWLVVMVTYHLSCHHCTAVVHQVFQGALRIFTKKIPAHVCMCLCVCMFVRAYIWMYVCNLVWLP